MVRILLNRECRVHSARMLPVVSVASADRASESDERGEARHADNAGAEGIKRFDGRAAVDGFVVMVS